MKIKQFNHLWNGQDSKKTPANYFQDHLESLDSKCVNRVVVPHPLSPSPSSNGWSGWSQSQLWRKEGRTFWFVYFQNLPAVLQIPFLNNCTPVQPNSTTTTKFCFRARFLGFKCHCVIMCDFFFSWENMINLLFLYYFHYYYSRIFVW